MAVGVHARRAAGTSPVSEPRGGDDVTPEQSDYAIVAADDVEDPYAGTDVPGEFRSLTHALGSDQLALTLIRVPPHADFEQGTGHRHEELEELYIVVRGTLTWKLGDDVREVPAGTAVRVAPGTPRSHRNEGDEPVELWAVSRKLDRSDAVKLDDFWKASPQAAQRREPSG
jgi:mannose-6-phosphate isomerase-like protein (cupin superfamily)